MITVRSLSRLDDTQRGTVHALVAAAERSDGVAPLGEHTLIGLERTDRTHLLAGDLAGYAQLDSQGGAELVVDPAERRQGVGTALLDALRAEREIEVWAHGTGPGALALAARSGAQVDRRLLQMQATLDRLPPTALPDGLSLRAFLPGLDDDEWLALNARAFVALPDQGGWTQDDLADRIAQDWFDPAGFLLAVDATGRVLGFHWTKTTEEPRPDGGHEHVGEVYVVGVDPDVRGGGLGRALTLAGLHHLASTGIRQVTLFVDSANTAALPMYTSLGFAVVRTDTLYRVPPHPTPSD